MRWAYSGSMRPEFKVLAVKLLGETFAFCNQRVAFGHDFDIWTTPSSRAKAMGTHVKAARLLDSHVALSVRTIEAERHREFNAAQPSVSFLQTPAWGRSKVRRSESLGWFNGTTDLLAQTRALSTTSQDQEIPCLPA